LRDVEGFGFERTQKELNTMFAAADDMDEDCGGAASAGIPEAIASMLGDKEAVEALGSMIWYDRAVRRKATIRC
jgi:DNA mismatch repair protein MSH6